MSDKLPEFTLGTQEGKLTREYLCLRVTGRTYPDCTDYWDGNWVNCTVEVAAGAFRGDVLSNLRAGDFPPFYKQLTQAYENLGQSAVLETMEGWVFIHMDVDKRGHVECKCILRDEPGIGNKLEFRLIFDQTYLPSVLRGLEYIIQSFPVIGKP